MKLLFCVKGLNNPGGGAERVLTSIAGGLVRRGHQVAVLTFDDAGGKSYYPLDPNIERMDLGLGATDEPSNLVITLRRIATMRSVVKASSPDVAIAFMHSMFVPLGLALLGTQIPLVASEHTNFAHYSRKPLQALLLCVMPNLADLITCVSEQVRQTYPSVVGKRMVIVPNPVSVNVAAKADVVARAQSRKILLSVGRLDEGKDHATLVEAFSKIAARVLNWDLRIVGEGTLRPKLEAQIASLGLGERVSLPGASKDIESEYRKAQLFVMPSRYESFSLTTAEALAHYLPVVAFSDCPAIAQWIEKDRNGVLVKPNAERSVALADALLALMRSEQRRRLLACGSVATLEEYKLESVLDKWEEVLASVSHRPLRAKKSDEKSEQKNSSCG